MNNYGCRRTYKKPLRRHLRRPPAVSFLISYMFAFISHKYRILFGVSKKAKARRFLVSGFFKLFKVRRHDDSQCIQYVYSYCTSTVERAPRAGHKAHGGGLRTPPRMSQVRLYVFLYVSRALALSSWAGFTVFPPRQLFPTNGEQPKYRWFSASSLLSFH